MDQKVAIDANKQSIIQMRKETEEITGKTNDYIQAIDDANEARRTFNERSTAQAYFTEIQAIEDLKNGLITEEEARARNAKQALDIMNAKIGYVNDEVAAIEEARSRGLLNEKQYEDKIKEATKGLQEIYKDRAETEKALQMQPKLRSIGAQGHVPEISQIEQNAQRVQSALSNIFSVQSSATARWGLVNEITNLEITKADQVKNRRIDAIDKEEKRRIQAIERSGMSTRRNQGRRTPSRRSSSVIAMQPTSLRSQEEGSDQEQIQLQNQINQAATRQTGRAHPLV